MTKADVDYLVKKLRDTDRYGHLKQVLDKKRFNEAQAKIIVENMRSSKNRRGVALLHLIRFSDFR